MDPSEKKISVTAAGGDGGSGGAGGGGRPATPRPGGLPEALDEDDEDDDEALPQGLLCGPPQCYCIVEKWRGFERILPNKTRILRLWAAWGDEQENVRFVLDHTIRQQVQRLRELDREIDRYEAKVHLDRMRRHGVNYVQDTYLVGAGIELDGPGPGEEPEPAETAEAAAAVTATATPPLDGETQAVALEELTRRCDDLLRLQEQRARQEELLERLSAEIQEELNQRWMRRRQEELAAQEEPPEPDGGLDGELLLEQERVRTQLSTSLYIGLRLNTDLEAVKSDLDYSQQQWDSKERELQGLLQTLHTLELTVAPDGTPVSGGPSREPRPQATAEIWVDQARGLAKSCPGNDEDSDTGLSSMHSQDSDSVPVCESLV
ncbi:Ras association domain-containing protein 10 [Camelus dromedarius]|uniref:Ras association domain-containing protein 10 n=1 Tax=Camelus dromedarius TaxID=9838 RepID=A0A5N4DKV2_CAMDR|nr:Ras association domain-containing protein 10 [Camelus dromedarius]